ncbi:MAG: long-chain fatty acid--CoA ligase [Verrucomicrobiae bacterium]|nr:long-chain fatty acid--CoA ligase [Verrucomicrobiae bacterium]
MDLATAFRNAVSGREGKPALFWGQSEFSYADLWAHSVRVARALQHEYSVRPGDRVGLWLKNCPEFVPAFFGVLMAGGVVVPINCFLKPDEILFILQNAGIRVLMTDAQLAEHFDAVKSGRPELEFFRTDTLFSGGAPVDIGQALRAGFVRRSDSDLAVIIYTSGTTGRPKGAMLSHGNLLHNVNSCRIALGAIDADRFGVVLPLFHSYMITVGLLLPLFAGGSIVLVRSVHPLKNALAELVQRRATILPAFPQLYRGLASVPGELTLPFRICISGAAPLPVQVLTDFESRFGIPLIEGYGLSEASPVVSLNPVNGPRKPGSIGVPIYDVEVSVQDDHGNILGPGEVGEICVRGGNVMLGYWNAPEETAQAFRNGWLLTGDVGYKDQDGYFYITDRKKDMLIVHGMNVYPREIEEVIYQFPGVREAAVVGMPDPRRGEQPVAFVAPEEGVTLQTETLKLFLKSKLADYKVPNRIHFVPALPRNATGKVVKPVLRQWLQEKFVA